MKKNGEYYKLLKASVINPEVVDKLNGVIGEVIYLKPKKNKKITAIYLNFLQEQDISFKGIQDSYHVNDIRDKKRFQYIDEYKVNNEIISELSRLDVKTKQIKAFHNLHKEILQDFIKAEELADTDFEKYLRIITTDVLFQIPNVDIKPTPDFSLMLKLYCLGKDMALFLAKNIAQKAGKKWETEKVISEDIPQEKKIKYKKIADKLGTVQITFNQYFTTPEQYLDWIKSRRLKGNNKRRTILQGERIDTFMHIQYEALQVKNNIGIEENAFIDNERFRPIIANKVRKYEKELLCKKSLKK